jgi:hypothetical protein
MKRRSFIQSLLAIPVVAALTKFAHAEKPKPLPDNPPSGEYKLRGIGKDRPDPQYAWFRAGDSIHKGILLQRIPNTLIVIPWTTTAKMRHFAGVAIHDAMEGDTIRVGVEGTFPVLFK